MKLYDFNRDRSLRLQNKLQLKIKLSLLLMIVFLLQVNTTAFAQKISFSKRNATIKEVFQQITRQTGYEIVYGKKRLDDSKTLDVNFKDTQLNEVMKQCLKGLSLTYAIEDKVIIVKPEGSNTSSEKKMATVVVKGKVVDEQEIPIPGVNVLIKGPTTRGAQTNPKGEFVFNASVGDVLVFSFIGYKSKEVTVVANQPPLNIVLHQAQNQMNEVVVSTGIFKKNDQTYTGSAVTITAKELQQYGNRNIITALRNFDPSFRIVESNSRGSDPNKMPDVQIRGMSSVPNVNDLGKEDALLGLNTPLVILDGFQSTLEYLMKMNDNDIETITILKDASATSIYGSRGANGVLVISTKMPKGGKLRVSYGASLNLEAPDLSSYNLLNAQQKLDLEYKGGYYSDKDPEKDLRLKRYYNYLMSGVNSGVNTYWLSQPVRKAFGQRHSLRFEGGDQKFRYSASLGINDIEGAMKGSGQKNHNGNISLAYTYRNVRINNTLMIADGNSVNSPYGEFSNYTKLNPYWAPYTESGQIIKFLGDSGNGDYLSRWETLPTNPLYDATLGGFDKSSSTGFTNNTSIEWSHRNLTVRGRLGLTKSNNHSDAFRTADNSAFASYAEKDFFRKGDYRYSVGNLFSYDGALNLSYSKAFKRHILFAGLDYSIREDRSSGNSFIVEGFPNANSDIMSMGLQYAPGSKPSGTESLNRSVGITSNLNYSYAGRYFVDGSLRFDGSSQFGSEKRFAPFLSLGAGWNIHNEEFMTGQKVVDRLKIRGSFGSTGSQNFSSSQSISTYQYYTNDRYNNWTGAALKALGNSGLEWQKVMKYNLGMDAEFLKGWLRVTADAYLQRTNGLISVFNLPASSGFPFYIDNIGKIQNKGYELRVTGTLIRNPERRINWNITAAVTHNENKVVELSQTIKDKQAALDADPKGFSSNSTIGVREGYSLNSIWAVRSMGIDPNSGKELYLTKDGLPTFTWNARDMVYVGTTNPKFEGGISSMFRYSNFSCNISLGYRLGGQVYNQTLIDRVEITDFRYNVDSRVYTDRWQAPGDKAAFKGLLVTTPTNKTSRFVQNESTLNCQNINLQYTMNSIGLSKTLKFETLSFGTSIADAFYISTVKRERGTNYPFSRQFSLTINATF